MRREYTSDPQPLTVTIDDSKKDKEDISIEVWRGDILMASFEAHPGELCELDNGLELRRRTFSAEETHFINGCILNYRLWKKNHA